MTTTRTTRMRKRIQMMNQLGRGELSCLEVASPCPILTWERFSELYRLIDRKSVS